MKNTSIEWADHSINFHIGCTKISPGCQNCYMYRLEQRWGRDPSVVRETNWNTIVSNLKKWEPSIIFANSMSDVFHKDIPDEKIERMFRFMAMYPKHTYLILTKRAKRMKEFFEKRSEFPIPDCFWLGVSVENDKYMDRVFELKDIPVSKRFVSFEPLIGNIDAANLTNIDWAIVGGESGTGSRKMEAEWVLNLKRSCEIYGTKFFFKQWGGNTKCSCHKSWGCRLLDNKTWDEMPELRTVIQ